MIFGDSIDTLHGLRWYEVRPPKAEAETEKQGQPRPGSGLPEPVASSARMARLLSSLDDKSVVEVERQS